MVDLSATCWVGCAVPGASSPPLTPSLKPLTALPRSEPMLPIFLVPKINMTTTSTISQCQILIEPIIFSLQDVKTPEFVDAYQRQYNPCGRSGAHSAPWPRAAVHMQVQVVDLLAAVRAG